MEQITEVTNIFQNLQKLVRAVTRNIIYLLGPRAWIRTCDSRQLPIPAHIGDGTVIAAFGISTKTANKSMNNKAETIKRKMNIKLMKQWCEADE